MRGNVLWNQNPRIFWSGLTRLIQEKRCLPIIGSGVNAFWFSSLSDLATKLSESHGYPMNDTVSLPAVAQYLMTIQGEGFPEYEFLHEQKMALLRYLPEFLNVDQNLETVTKIIQDIGWEKFIEKNPDNIYTLLASLDLPVYLTTNYDGFLIAALEAQGKKPISQIHGWKKELSSSSSTNTLFRDGTPSVEMPLVYHLFGKDENLNTMLLTESEHFDFLTNISNFPDLIRSALSENAWLFIGYNFQDLGFRILIHTFLTAQDPGIPRKHVAVLDDDSVTPQNIEVYHSFIRQYFMDRDFNVIWEKSQFISSLVEYLHPKNMVSRRSRKRRD